MQQEDKVRLQQNRVALLDIDVDASNIINQLYEDKVVDLRFIEDLKACPTVYSKTELLLNTLPKLGPNAYRSFRKALCKSYAWLVEKLDNTDVDVLCDKVQIAAAAASAPEVVKTTGVLNVYGEVTLVVGDNNTVSVENSAQGSQVLGAENGTNKVSVEGYENLPFPPSSVFTPRDGISERIHQNLHSEKRLAILSGLWGTGKTTSVIEYAHQQKKYYSGGILYIDADNKTTLKSSYRKIARDLKLEYVSAEDAQYAIIKYLLEQGHAGKCWLVIFDGVDNTEILKEIGKPMLYLPRWDKIVEKGGHVLVSSRLDDFQTLNASANSVQIELPNNFSDSEAITFLEKRCVEGGKIHKDEKNMKILVQRVPCLPLCIEQVASFIIEHKYSFKKYVSTCINKEGQFKYSSAQLGHCKDFKELLKSNLKALGESPVALLYLCSFCYTNSIPVKIFVKGLAKLKEYSEDSAVIKLVYDIENSGCGSILEELAQKHRFILWVPSESGEDANTQISVHNMIHSMMRENMQEQEVGAVYLRYLLLTARLLKHLLKNHKDCVLQNSLLPHAEQCLKYLTESEEKCNHSDFILTKLRMRLMLRTARAFANMNAFTYAMQQLDELKKEIEKRSREKTDFSNWILKFRKNVNCECGLTLRRQGKLEEAVENLKAGYEYMLSLNSSEELHSEHKTNREAFSLEKADIAMKIGNAYVDSHHYDEALKYLERAKLTIDSLVNKDGVDVRTLEGRLQSLYGKLNIHLSVKEKGQSSTAMYKEMVQIAQSYYRRACDLIPPDHYRYYYCMIKLSRINCKLDTSKEYIRKAIEETKGNLEQLNNLLPCQEHRHYVYCQMKFARILMHLPECLDESAKLIEEVIRKLTSIHKDLKKHRLIGNAYCYKGDIKHIRGQYKDALENYEKCITHYSESNPNIAIVKKKISCMKELLPKEESKGGDGKILDEKVQDTEDNEPTSPTFWSLVD